MPNLADSLQCRKFVQNLEACENESRWLSDKEKQFVEDMRECFNAREDQMDMGAPVWNPTASQANYLSALAAKVNL